MDKYIKLEPLLKELEESTPYNWSNEDYEQGEVNGYKYAVSIVEAQDTADVTEVKHGKWVYHECVSSYDGAISGYSCSECFAFVDEDLFDSDKFHKDFCGHCGARMGGEEE